MTRQPYLILYFSFFNFSDCYNILPRNDVSRVYSASHNFELLSCEFYFVNRYHFSALFLSFHRVCQIHSIYVGFFPFESHLRIEFVSYDSFRIGSKHQQGDSLGFDE